MVYESDAGFQVRVHDWWKQKMGMGIWDELNRNWHTITKMSKADFQDKLDELSKILSEL